MTTTTGNGRAKLPPEMTPLEMARNLTRHIGAYALAADEDPVAAHVNRLGERQHVAAELAAQLALVSLAEDVHRITEAVMSGRFGGPPL